MRLSRKQRVQLEIIDCDHDLEKLACRDPTTKSLVDRIRDALFVCVCLMDGTDVREFCSCHSWESGGE
jgi:hypothetical protein